MNFKFKNTISSIVTVFIVTMFFSCEGSLKQVQKSSIAAFMPVGEADSINVKYTDSGKILTTLVSLSFLILLFQE